MKRVLIALLLCGCGLAQAQPAYWTPYRPQLQGDPRHMPPPYPGGQQRWEERRRLREDVQRGPMPREVYRNPYRNDPRADPRADPRYDPRSEQIRDEYRRRQLEGRRPSPEQREQMRRDILDANRNLGRR
jgi:hypothetical protein